MTKQENIEAVTRFRDAFDREDIDALIDLVSPELVFTGPRGTIESREAWRAIITQAPASDEAWVIRTRNDAVCSERGARSQAREVAEGRKPAAATPRGSRARSRAGQANRSS